MRILLVEDQVENVTLIRRVLEGEGFTLDVVVFSDATLDCMIDGEYDLAVLDVMHTREHGFTICRQAREAGVTTPILMLTPTGSTDDRIAGLDSGADDCMSAPFNEAELRARVRALIRRHERLPDLFLAVGPIRIDLSTQTVMAGNREVSLAETEYRLLIYLLRNAGLIVSRIQILDRVWGSDFSHSPNIVDVYIRHLRLKLEAAGVNDFITTVWGSGWRVARHPQRSVA